MNHNESLAYKDGLRDGEDWDAPPEDSGYTLEDLLEPYGGFSETTLNAVGVDACCKAWGLTEAEGEAWEQALADYECVARAAVKARLSQEVS